jgi:hypothetical protein
LIVEERSLLFNIPAGIHRVQNDSCGESPCHSAHGMEIQLSGTRALQQIAAVISKELRESMPGIDGFEPPRNRLGIHLLRPIHHGTCIVFGRIFDPQNQ